MKTFVLAFAVFCLACSGRSDRLKPDYFSGEITAYADSVLFSDCATGVGYRLSENDAYAEIVRKYRRIASWGQRVYMTCRAHVERNASGGPDPAEERLSVGRLISLGEAGGCDWQYQLAGLYESGGPQHRQVLRLKPDRTFETTDFLDEGETHAYGRWGLASELVLLLDYPDGSRMSFQLIPDRQMLVSDDRTLSFTKVYL